ncbi:Inosine/uridine-preferring nucleoside hydrolase domain-containing protein [Pisolithus albus]|nr:Inosine/uridine-preferring nucleoside hydrolase domain-containing protein [Pisolithus albus]
MTASSFDRRYIWLDADPGHDDVTAILLAVYLENIKLLGISTVHGNSSAYWTGVNAARALYAFNAPDHIKVYPGTVKPLTRKVQYAPNIHGEDGLGGVVGLPPPDSPEAKARFALREDGTSISALEGMVTAIKETWKNGAGHKVSVLLEAVEQFVFMGGGIGLGNVTPAAEFNIACDPEAAQIVLDCPVKTVMVPLNQSIQTRLCAATVTQETSEKDVPVPSTSLRLMLSSLITFFAHTYKEVFGFDYGPPLHDALTVAYVSNPNLFKGKRYRVDVELQGRHTTGETVADIWDYQQCDDTWGAAGKNCLVLESLEVDQFFDVLLDCVDSCDRVSPLNARPL